MKLRNLAVLAIFAAVAVFGFQFSSGLTAGPLHHSGATVAPSLAQDGFLQGAELTAGTDQLCGGPCIGNCKVPICSTGCSCKFCGGHYNCFR